MGLFGTIVNDITNGKFRKEESAGVDESYEYVHRYVYADGQVLEPIAVLKVDPPPFPKDQKPNLVQILEIADTVLPLLTNVVVMLTNLLGVGSVPDGAPEAGEVRRVLDDLKEHHRLIGQLMIDAHEAIART